MSVISNAVPTTPASTLRGDIIRLRDELGADPDSHEHGPVGEGCPDCLGCLVVASLEDALHHDEARHTLSGRGRA